MPIGPARMPLMDHLGELRRRLTIVVVSVLAATVFMYAVMLSLYEVSLMITRFVVVARDGKAGLTESRLGLFGDDEDDDE